MNTAQPISLRAGDVDPITSEVVRNRLESAVREMANITLRTARSAVVAAGRDFSCAIFDPQGQLIIIGTSIPPHIMPMLVAMQSTLKLYEGDVAPGDIFIGNDPHDGGTHLNDVAVFMPMFHQGTLIGYAGNRAHWADVGGGTPGSLSGQATEIFQEGLRIPPVRAGRNYELNAEIIRFIERNVRVPHEATGDLKSQVASCRVAQQRLVTIAETYGLDTLLATMDDILDAAERRMRARIAALPDSSVVHEAYLDNDGNADEPILLRAAVTIAGNGLTVDFTGSSGQRRGCLNVGIGTAEGFAFMGVKAALDPKGPINSGTFRPIRVVAPLGSCLNAEPPAACGGIGELGLASILTMATFAGLVPDQVSAEEGASAHHQNLDGVDRRPGRGRYVYYDAIGAGCGARAGKDGMDYARTLRSGNFTMMSIEALETKFPIVFERIVLRTDSGGPGRFRGGMGITREYRVLEDSLISILSDHSVIPAPGLEGGHRGAPTVWQVVHPDGSTEPVSPRFGSKGSLRIHAGDVVRLETPGGGGWGDPLAREPARVLKDVAEGRVSPDRAKDDYGVVIDPDQRSIDEVATAALREQLRARNRMVPLLRGGPARLERGMRTAWAAPGSEWKAGSIVELFVKQRPQALTIRIAQDDGVDPDALRLDSEAWEFMDLDTADARGQVRLVLAEGYA